MANEKLGLVDATTGEGVADADVRYWNPSWVNPTGTLEYQDIYVDTAGSDSNLGTSGSPFATISKALSIINALRSRGNSINLKKGQTHQLTGTTDIKSSVTFSAYSSGANPIIDLNGYEFRVLNESVAKIQNITLNAGVSVPGGVYGLFMCSNMTGIYFNACAIIGDGANSRRLLTILSGVVGWVLYNSTISGGSGSGLTAYASSSGATSALIYHRDGGSISEYTEPTEGLSNYTLPTASAGTLGGVKVGTSLSIADGVLNSDIITANRQEDSYVLALTDAGKMIYMNKGTANTLTIPKDAVVNFALDTTIAVMMEGTGQTTIDCVDGDVNLNGVAGGGCDISEQFGVVTLVKRAANSWVAFGARGAIS